MTHGRSHTNRLTIVPAGHHDTGGTKGDVGSRYQTSTDKKILNIAAVKTTVGNLIHPRTMKLRAAGFITVNTIRWMQVNRPSAKRHRIIKCFLIHDI